MALPSDLSRYALREVALAAMVERPVPPETIAAMCETLLTLLDEAEDADEACASIDDLHGCIPRLEELRAAAVKEKDEAVAKRDAELRAVVDELAASRALVAETADDWKRRAEKAEHDLAEGRSNVELALQRRKTAEDDARRLSSVLLGIVDGNPLDAWKSARLALGRDLIDRSGTAPKREAVADCKSCRTRKERGFDGPCPACGAEMTRGEKSAERAAAPGGFPRASCGCACYRCAGSVHERCETGICEVLNQAAIPTRKQRRRARGAP